MVNDLPSKEEENYPGEESADSKNPHTLIDGTSSATNGDKSTEKQNESRRYLQIVWEWIRFVAWQKFAWPTIRSSEFWTALATVIIALFTALTYTIVKDSTQDTQQLITAAQSQAQSAGVMAAAADKIKQAAQDMVAQDQRIADNASHALEASSKQSSVTLDASIEASHLDQRAWVGSVAASLVPNTAIKADTDTTVQIAIENTGKTPALDVAPHAHWNILMPDSPLTVENGSSFFQSTNVLFPNQAVTLTTDKFQIPAIELPLITKGDMVFKIWGEIPYDDVFGRHHWTKFCIILAKNLESLNACSEYNGTDDQKKNPN